MTIWRLSIMCLIPKATNTHSEYVTLIVFPRNNGYANSPRCYVIPTLHVLLERRFESTKDEMLKITSLARFEVLTAL